MTVTQYGIVATSLAAASQAGVSALQQGGNAIDAAIAANAALGVVEPMRQTSSWTVSDAKSNISAELKLQGFAWRRFSDPRSVAGQGRRRIDDGDHRGIVVEISTRSVDLQSAARQAVQRTSEATVPLAADAVIMSEPSPRLVRA